MHSQFLFVPGAVYGVDQQWSAHSGQRCGADWSCLNLVKGAPWLAHFAYFVKKTLR